MAQDEAVVRVVISPGGSIPPAETSSTSTPAPVPTQSAHPVPPPSPATAPPPPATPHQVPPATPPSAPAQPEINIKAFEQAQKEVGAAKFREQVKYYRNLLDPPVQEPPPDPFDVARKELEAKRFKRDVKAASDLLIEQDPSLAEPKQPENKLDAFDVAQKEIDAKNFRKEVDAAKELLDPPKPEKSFDAARAKEVAEARVERERQLELIDEEYRKLKPKPEPPPFDPVAVAKKRVERERQQALVDEEYKKLKPPPEESLADKARQWRERIHGYGKLARMARGVLDLISLLGESKTSGKTAPSGAEAKAKPVLDAIPLEEEKSHPPNAPPEGHEPSFGPSAEIEGGPSASPQNWIPHEEARPPNAPPESHEPSSAPANETGVPTATKIPDASVAVGEAGGMMGAAMAAVPIALAVKAIVDAVNSIVIGGIRGVMGGITGFASAAADPSTDTSTTIAKFGDTVSKTGEKIASVNPLLGWTVVAVGEVNKSLGGLMQAIDGTVQRYGEYNALIAQAQAFAEIRQVMGDLRRSKELAPELAAYVKAQADFQQKVEDLKVKILVKILPLVTRILEVLEKMMPGEELTTVLAGSVQAATIPFKAVAAVANEILALMSKNDAKSIEDPIDQLFRKEFDNRGGEWLPGEGIIKR